MSTGWPLEGSHRNVDCASCHVGGIFEGTPRQCVACHSRAGLVKATAPSITHIRTTDECDACHRETTWSYVRPVDHKAVVGTCFSCHNGLTATGKPPDPHPDQQRLRGLPLDARLDAGRLNSREHHPQSVELALLVLASGVLPRERRARSLPS